MKNKKLIVALMLSMSMLVGCTSQGGAQNNNGTNSSSQSQETTTYSSAVELAQQIWGLYGDEDKFPIAGGDFDHGNMEGPDVFDIEANAENFTYMVLVPDEMMDEIENDVASMQHMMNTNTFSSAVFKLKNSDKANELADMYKKHVQANEWMCGFPDTVLVLSKGDYMIVAYGEDELIQTFKQKCTSDDVDANLLVDAPVGE